MFADEESINNGEQRSAAGTQYDRREDPSLAAESLWSHESGVWEHVFVTRVELDADMGEADANMMWVQGCLSQRGPTAATHGQMVKDSGMSCRGRLLRRGPLTRLRGHASRSDCKGLPVGRQHPREYYMPIRGLMP